MDLITTTTAVTYSNKELEKATETIIKLGTAIKNNLYNVAFVLASVDKTECYKDDGFNNVQEWAMKTFGFKKSVCYSLLRIGKEYTRELKNPKNGRVTGYTSNLLPVNSGTDFTTTQIECMLPLGEYKDVSECVESGTITPDMSCKRIKEIVKKITHPETEAETEPEEVETAPEEAENEPENELCITSVNFDEHEDGTFTMHVDCLNAEGVARVLRAIEQFRIMS